MFGVGCCAPKLSSNVPPCPPGKFGREERCIIPPLPVRQRKVRCVIKAGGGGRAAQGHAAGSWKTQETDSLPVFFTLATSFLQHAGSTSLDLESALGGCPQRNGDCQSLQNPASFIFQSCFQKGRAGKPGDMKWNL